MPSTSRFYFRYYVGHKDRVNGHEFMEYEFDHDGHLKYANSSHYKGDFQIRKEAYVTNAVLKELQQMIDESHIMDCDDSNWPEPNELGKQELEIKYGDYHICFTCSKINTMGEIQKSKDVEGLTTFYYLVQDVRSLVLSLIGLHFKIKPIP